MASASQFIGAHISLTSTSEIRYRGILTEIDHSASTIQLRNVYSMGTENRRPADEYLPPNDTPYEFIVFRAAEVKDLAVERAPPPPPQQRSVLQDPAVIGASGGGAPVAQPPPQAPTAPPEVPSVPAPVEIPVAEPTKEDVTETTAETSGSGNVRSERTQQKPTNSRERSSASVRSAEVAVDNVEKAMGDLRVSHHAGGGSRRGGRAGGDHIRGPGVVPETPFDFARSNAKFNKAAASPSPGVNSASSGTPSPALAEASTSQPAEAGTTTKFYDKQKSFFDDISSDSRARAEGEVVTSGAAAARQRREEERNRNLSTFGEVAINWPVGSPQHNARRGGRRRFQGGNRTQGAGAVPPH